MEKIFEKPILIWSDYCNYSKNFINALVKHKDVYDAFIRINIDVDPNTRQRPQLFYQIQTLLNFKISQVPTIIVNNGQYILSGVEAFKWLDYTINKKQVVKHELVGFNPVEMGSFSDSYAKYGSTKLHDATEQSFKFLNKQEEKIETPQEEGALSQEEMMRKQRERETMELPQKRQFTENFSNMNANVNNNKEINLSQYANNRNQNVFMPKSNNSRIDFTADSFGFAGEANNTNLSRSQMKQQEIDARLQQLLAERESSVPPRAKAI